MSAYLQTINFQVTIKRAIRANSIDDAEDKGWADQPPPFTILPAPGVTVMYVATSAAANCDTPIHDNIEPASPDTIVPVELNVVQACAMQSNPPAYDDPPMYYGNRRVDFIKTGRDSLTASADENYVIWYCEDDEDTEAGMYDEFSPEAAAEQPITVMLPANHPQARA